MKNVTRVTKNRDSSQAITVRSRDGKILDDLICLLAVVFAQIIFYFFALLSINFFLAFAGLSWCLLTFLYSSAPVVFLTFFSFLCAPHIPRISVTQGCTLPRHLPTTISLLLLRHHCVETVGYAQCFNILMKLQAVVQIFHLSLLERSWQDFLAQGFSTWGSQTLRGSREDFQVYLDGSWVFMYSLLFFYILC